MTKTAQLPEREAKLKATAKLFNLNISAKKAKRAPQITFAAAQEKYGLAAADLQLFGLPACEKVCDRKFDSEELEYIAAKKKAHLKNCKIEERAQKAAELIAKIRPKQIEHQAGLDLLEKWPKKGILTDLKPTSDSKLPADIWMKISKTIAEDFERIGVRGPSVVARDLCNLSRVNKELYIASSSAFQHLSSLCEPIHSSITLTQANLCTLPQAEISDLWERLVSDPGTLGYRELQTMYDALGLTGKFTKATLAHKLCQQIGIDRPTNFSARLLLAVRKERKSTDRQLSALYSRATGSWAAWPHTVGTFDLRLRCIRDGFPTSRALRAAFALQPHAEDDNFSEGEALD